MLKSLDERLAGVRSWAQVAHLACLAALLLFPLGAPFLWSEFYVNLTTKVFIFGIFLFGFDLLAGYTGMVSFGHAMFFGLGAYIAGLLLLHIAPSLFLALLTGTLAASIAGYAIGFLAIRTKGVYFVFITLAISQFFYLVAFHWDSLTGGDNGLPGFPELSINAPLLPSLPMGNQTVFYYFTLVFFVAAYLIARRLIRSPFGNILTYICENEERAEFVGYDINHYKRRAFLISGVFSGFAGSLYAIYQGYVSPDLLHWTLSGDAIIMTWLGGVRTLVGPVLGAGLNIYLGDWLGSWTENWMIVMGIAYVLFVLFSPNGMFGLAQQTLHRIQQRRRHVA